MPALLSYPIDDHIPAWLGSPQLTIDCRSGIARGNMVNTVGSSMYNHTSTLMDVPNHYLAEGLPIAVLPAERFVYDWSLLIEISPKPCEKTTTEDLQPYEVAIAACNLLLLYSGASKTHLTD